MKILMLVKYPPIQGGVSVDAYWTAQFLAANGHDVHVLTNAPEVENEYKIHLSEYDESLLTGYWNRGFVKLHTTYRDPNHVFIPQSNPSVSKLYGVGLEVCKAFCPDVIWSYYFEPFGLVSLLLSKSTGIPYVFKHAGSDLGRLMQTPQLRPAYCEILKNAAAILTRKIHFDNFVELGVSPERLWRSFAIRLPEQLFSLVELKSPSDVFQLGIYGKTGPAKGTKQLIEAAIILKKEGFRLRIRAHWGGRDINQYLNLITANSLEDVFEVLPFIPHWKIPDFIKSCDMVCFLENKFKIKFHNTFVPLEVIACGIPLMTTLEVQSKASYQNIFVDDKNCFLIKEPVNGENIAIRIKEAFTSLRSGRIERPAFDAVLFHAEAIFKLTQTIKRLERIIG